jgi:hypothetical protein
MKPSEIEVLIEELVLGGFDPRSRWTVAYALERELHAVPSRRGHGFPLRSA